MTEEQNSLDLLIRHETAMKQLYEQYAEAFPEHRTFWANVAAEEQKHANCLQGLSVNDSLRKWFMNDGRFKKLAIGGSLEYIEKQIERAKNAPVSLVEALSIANDIEEALIEKQFISLNISGPEEIKSVMKGLVADTQRHKKMIAEKLIFHKREAR
ncbi:MAG: hypothetical protein M0009_13525 [Deltaproteobacteria bacterium]|nr:hypothetical protein [Deltaproteobacteria bacterium]